MLGGDGTFFLLLATPRRLTGAGAVPIVGVNFGRLDFASFTCLTDQFYAF